MKKDNSETVRRLFGILCNYKPQSEQLNDFLMEKVWSKYFPVREILFEHHSVVGNAIFISSGYLAVYGFNVFGDRQLLAILGSGSIALGKSFTFQFASDLEVVALSGTYLLLLSHRDMVSAFGLFEGTETLVRMIMADNAEKEHGRLIDLKQSADDLILAFYKAYPDFLHSGLLLDVDLASYLLIGEQTLRNVRMKLIRDGKLRSSG